RRSWPRSKTRKARPFAARSSSRCISGMGKWCAWGINSAWAEPTGPKAAPAKEVNRPPRAVRLSYWFVALPVVLAGWLHLATPLLSVLFSYFVLSKLHFAGRKWLALSLFVVALLGIAYGLAHFINQAIIALPKVAETAVPSFIAWAQQRGIELPFTD